MLLIVPSPLSQTNPQMPVLQADLELIRRCNTWVVESPKPARAALKHFGMPAPINTLQILPINSTSEHEIAALLKQASETSPVGLMSDAGCPGVADPGSFAVKIAHQQNCTVYPLVGPNSIILGLMASGLNGQNFHFLGYPPVNKEEKINWLKTRENASRMENSTQIAIETPYRNQKLTESLLQTLKPNTELCIATDLTGPNMNVKTHTVGVWKTRQPLMSKTPTLYLWLASS